MNIKTAMDRDMAVSLSMSVFMLFMPIFVCATDMDMDIHSSPCPCPYVQLLTWTYTVVHVHVHIYSYCSKKENILYIITSLLQFQNIHTLYTISHITENFWAQEWRRNIFFWEIQEVGPLK